MRTGCFLLSSGVLINIGISRDLKQEAQPAPASLKIPEQHFASIDRKLAGVIVFLPL